MDLHQRAFPCSNVRETGTCNFEETSSLPINAYSLKNQLCLRNLKWRGRWLRGLFSLLPAYRRTGSGVWWHPRLWCWFLCWSCGYRPNRTHVQSAKTYSSTNFPTPDSTRTWGIFWPTLSIENVLETRVHVAKHHGRVPVLCRVCHLHELNKQWSWSRLFWIYEYEQSNLLSKISNLATEVVRFILSWTSCSTYGTHQFWSTAMDG